MRTAPLAFASALALTSGAFAADAIVEPVSEVFSWTGAYIGAFGGITAGDRDYSVDVLGVDVDASVSNSGGLVGGVIGYDYQMNNFVVGAYADIAHSGDCAEVSADADGIGSLDVSSNLDYLGTVQLRVGAAVDRALLYAHGGFAYGRTSYEIDLDAVSAPWTWTSKTRTRAATPRAPALNTPSPTPSPSRPTTRLSISAMMGWNSTGRGSAWTRMFSSTPSRPASTSASDTRSLPS